MDDFVLQPGFTIDAPSMSDYFGLWMVEPDSFCPLVNRHNGINLHAHIKSESAAEAVKQQSTKQFHSTSDGIAIFRADGPMMKRASSLSGGTSTVRLRQQIRQARQDGDVTGGIMVMDTPGGTAKGNCDLCDEVARFAQAKPLMAFVEDMTASAGVSVASQATRIHANNATAMYGAMGTFAVLVDQSRLAENLGVRVHVIKAGEFKGMGEPGTAFTEQQLEEAQRIVNRLNDQYLAMIARGRQRTVDSLRPLADGRVIFAADAQMQGLIDGVSTFDEAMSEVRGMVKAGTKTTVQITSAETPIESATDSTAEPSSETIVDPAETETTSKEESDMDPATLQELKDKFPNAESDWLLSQLEKQSTVTDAAINYASHVQEQAATAAEAHKQELEKTKAAQQEELEKAQAAAAAKTGSTGFQPLTLDDDVDDPQQNGDPVNDFDAAVLTYMNRHKVDRQRAISAVKRNHPELFKSYMLATNPKAWAQRSLKERFDALGV